jgi:predicted PurR-regulated permease PerM
MTMATTTAGESSAPLAAAAAHVHGRLASSASSPPRQSRLMADASTVKQHRALQLLAIGALVALIWIAHTVGVGLFLGVLLAFTMEPVQTRLRARKWSPRAAALVCMLGTVTVVTTTVVAFAVAFVTRGVTFVRALPPLVAPGGALRTLVERRLVEVHANPAAVFAHLEAQAVSLESRAGGLAAGIVGATLEGLLTVLFMSLAMYYVLRHWNEIVARAEGDLPFNPRHTRALFGQFRKVGSEVLRGTVVAGAVQGALAGLGYWVCGVPDPVFFGALTAAASVVPAIGTALVWGSAGVYLIATHHVLGGVVELLYGALVVGILTDYVIRPRLVGGSAGVPAVLTFVSLFGGVQVFGVIGLIVGPVIVTLCVAVLKTYEEEHGDSPASA